MGLCSPHRPAPSSWPPQRNAGSPPELNGHTQSLAPLYRTVREENSFLHSWLTDTTSQLFNNVKEQKSAYSRVRIHAGHEDVKWFLRSVAVWAVLEWHMGGQGSPTVVWRPVWGGCSAGPTAPPPHPAAFWLYGCRSARAGSSGCWWYSIARLWGQGGKKSRGLRLYSVCGSKGPSVVSVLAIHKYDITASLNLLTFDY